MHRKQKILTKRFQDPLRIKSTSSPCKVIFISKKKTSFPRQHIPCIFYIIAFLSWRSILLILFCQWITVIGALPMSFTRHSTGFDRPFLFSTPRPTEFIFIIMIIFFLSFYRGRNLADPFHVYLSPHLSHWLASVLLQ